MKHMHNIKKYGVAVALFAPLVASAQSSDIATAATGALTTTKTDVTTVAVAVAAVVALIVAATLIFSMLKKG